MEMQLLCGYPDTPDKNPNHAMFRLPNGLKVRPIQICGGTPGKAATVTAFADVHLNFCDETDREEANPSILSTPEMDGGRCGCSRFAERYGSCCRLRSDGAHR